MGNKIKQSKSLKSIRKIRNIRKIRKIKKNQNLINVRSVRSIRIITKKQKIEWKGGWKKGKKIRMILLFDFDRFLQTLIVFKKLISIFIRNYAYK